MALLENVEKLSKPYVETVDQEQNGKTKKVKITHPPLFVQLDEAVSSSQTTVKRGGTLASQRNVIDTSAWMLRDAIYGEMHALWGRLINKRMPDDLVTAISRWHLEVRNAVDRGRLQAGSVWKAVRRTGAWVAQIEMKFDPPVTLEVTRPCPECEHKHVYNEHNERVAAVVIVWQKSFANSNAVCRACAKTWYGETELRQLRYEIDKRDTSIWDS